MMIVRGVWALLLLLGLIEVSSDSAKAEHWIEFSIKACHATDSCGSYSYAAYTKFELRNDNGDLVFSGESDLYGFVTTPTIPDGNYVLRVLPSQSPNLPDGGRFADVSVPVEVNSIMCPSVCSPSVNLFYALRYIKLTLTEANPLMNVGTSGVGDPVPGMLVQSTADNADPTAIDYRATRTNSSGVAYLAIPDDSPYRYFLRAKGVGFSDYYQNVQPLVGPGETSIAGTVAPASAAIQFNFVDGSGNSLAIPSSSTRREIACGLMETPIRFTTAIAAGVLEQVVEVYAGDLWCEVSVDGYETLAQRVTVAAGGQVEVSVPLISVVTDASIVVSLVDGAGDVFIVPTSVSEALVICRNVDSAKHYFERLLPGSSSAEVDVIGGSYDCGVTFNDYRGSWNNVLVSNNGTATVTSVVFAKNAEVRLRTIDAMTGELISGIDTEFSIFTSGVVSGTNNIEDEAHALSTTGEVLLPAIAGTTYYAGVRVGSDSSSVGLIQTVDGVKYLLPSKLALVSADSEDVQLVNFELIPVTSQVIVRVVYSDGSLVAKGYVEASSYQDFEDETADFNGDIKTGAPLVNNAATLSLIAGREYRLRVTLPQQINNPYPLIGKANVVAMPGETRELTIRLRDYNYNLRVEAVLPDDATEVVDRIACWAFHSTGRYNQAKSDDGSQPISIPLLVKNSSRWKVYCRVITEGEEPREYLGETFFRPRPNEKGRKIKVELEEGKILYSRQDHDFDTAYKHRTILPDGSTTLDIPAGAFAESGSGQLAVQSAIEYDISDQAHPLHAYDLSVTVDGQSVSEPMQPVTICFPVDLAMLATYGASTEDLYVAYYDSATGAWIREAQYTYDAELNTICATVTHFSVWGDLLDLARAARRQAPAALKLRKLRPVDDRARVRLCWEAPVAADAVTMYEVECIKRNQGWTRARTMKAKRTCKQRKLSPGRYKFRVRVESGAFSEVRQFRIRS